MRKTLVYAQDTGGAQNIAVITKELLQANELCVTIIIHPDAKATFEKFDIPFHLITELGFDLPLEESRVESLFVKTGCNQIFCGTSSQLKDPSNSNIIKVSRSLKIPCFATLDHWKGWDRFFDQGNNLTCAPDLLGCIDEYSFEKLQSIGFRKDMLTITGHPYLEHVYGQAHSATTDSVNPAQKRIVLVSQPMVERDFQSIFGLTLGAMPLISAIANIINELKQFHALSCCYRPHPKERKLDHLPEGIDQCPSIAWNDAVKETDIVIGLDSMALIEAFYATKKCISLKLPEFSGTTDIYCPIEFSKTVTNYDELEIALTNAIQGRNSFPNPEDNINSITKSKEKTMAAFLEFCGII